MNISRIPSSILFLSVLTSATVKAFSENDDDYDRILQMPDYNRYLTPAHGKDKGKYLEQNDYTNEVPNKSILRTESNRQEMGLISDKQQNNVPKNSPDSSANEHGTDQKEIKNARSDQTWINEKMAIDELLDTLVPKLVADIMERKAGSLDVEERDVFKRNNRETTTDEENDTDDVTIASSPDALENDEDEENNESSDAERSSLCDFVFKNLCCFNRQIGESLTIAINMSDVTQGEDSFAVRWFRIYGSRRNQSPVEAEIEPDRAPWNMVIGSGGTELRLSPITDTDTDRNRFIARVFSTTKSRSKKISKLTKKIEFCINILSIDLGTLYFGEELNINIENYVTIPETGISFEWGLEKSLDELIALPSNMKISRSGRSVTIKEWKKNKDGILTCIMYSSTGLAIAKRRFKIQNTKSTAERSVINENPYQQQHGNYLRLPIHGLKRVPYEDHEERKHSSVDNEFQYSHPYWKKRFRRSITTFSSKNDKQSYPDPQILYVFNRKESREIIRLPSSKYWKELTAKRNIRKKNFVTPHPVEYFSNHVEETLDNIIPKEIRYVNPTVDTILGETQSDTNANEQTSDIETRAIFNCTRNYDCGPKAFCVFSNNKCQNNQEGQQGICRCNPEYKGDGLRCHKRPYGLRRVKRIKRQIVNPAPQYEINDLTLKPNLFYADDKSYSQTNPPQPVYVDQNGLQSSYIQPNAPPPIPQQPVYVDQNGLQSSYIQPNAPPPIPPQPVYVDQNGLQSSYIQPNALPPIPSQPVYVDQNSLQSSYIQPNAAPPVPSQSVYVDQNGLQSNYIQPNAAPPIPLQPIYNYQNIQQENRQTNAQVVPDMQNPEPKILMNLGGDDSDASLLSKCNSKKECSLHANCIKSGNFEHQTVTYCRCDTGYRGNGIFCWEVADYIPEQPIIQRRRRFRIHWNTFK